MEYSYPLTAHHKLEQLEDEVAIVEAAKTNPAAFEPLYHYYKNRIYRYLYLRLGREEDAADVTQQVFLKALKGLPGYRVRGLPFAAWLFRIAYHATNDVYRHQKDDLSWEILENPDSVTWNSIRTLYAQETSQNIIILHPQSPALRQWWQSLTKKAVLIPVVMTLFLAITAFTLAFSPLLQNLLTHEAFSDAPISYNIYDNINQAQKIGNTTITLEK